ncbi:hypothetical protein [Flavobacterium gilvum]|uniref:Uncharacterized protein n=1 Tax=Flavobacterium gilvum TaxID=1492737 RepID=A0AAC9I2K5_9FLAO|nr:hypothetical protein [Flavobacterium gilvum]AOW09489.1 hypothetical protein EM308_08250 [Flavobacterium gilvum]
MKLPRPNERNNALGQILKYCSDQQNKGKPVVFGTVERWMINQERSRLFNEDTTWVQTPELESKIQFTLKKISDNNLIKQ